MRKKNREITEQLELQAVLDACDVCRVALSDDGQPYIIPLNFGYRLTGGQLDLYFHGATEGRKMDILRRNPRACFEMDCHHQLITGERACDYSMNYASIIGEGILMPVTGRQEKTDALACLMHHYSVRGDWAFDEAVLDKTAVLHLRVLRWTGKRLNKPGPGAAVRAQD